MKPLLILFLGAVLSGCSKPTLPDQTAPPALPASPALPALTPEALDAFVSAVVKDQHAIGVTVGVMQSGKVIFAKGYGVANTKTQTPVTPETLFAVGSVTKQ